MTEQRIDYYRPTRNLESQGMKKPFEISIQPFENNNNISHKIAQGLSKIATEECPQIDRDANPVYSTGEPVGAFFPYRFANGLIFRLSDDGSEENLMLQFSVPEMLSIDKQEILSRIPELLQMAGIEEGALISLKRILPNPTEIGMR